MTKNFISKILAMALVVSVALNATPVQAAEEETPPLGDSTASASPGAVATPSDTDLNAGILPSAAMTGTFGSDDSLAWALVENEEDGSDDLTYTLTVGGEGEIYYQDDPPWAGVPITAVVIEEGVTGIRDSAFSDETRLTAITLPDSLTTIAARAFWGCESLTEVVIPDNVRSLGYAAFGGCVNLTSVRLPDLIIDNIFDNPFTMCPGLADANGFVIFGNTLYGYYGEAEHVTIPDEVLFIGVFAFGGNTELTGVTIPDGVEMICDEAFALCENLTSIEIPGSVAVIGNSAFLECKGLADNDGFVIVNGTLYGYYGDGGAVIIPEGVINLDVNVFMNCDDITDIKLPNTLVSIQDGAFFGCDGLTGVNIPNRVDRIYKRAFGSCTGLNRITFNGGAPIFIDSDAFEGVTATVAYPPMLSWTDDKLQDYGGDLNWVSAGSSVGGLTWSLEKNGQNTYGDDTFTLIISGTGPMESYEESFPPWYDSDAKYFVTEVLIDSGVTSVGESAFSELTSLTRAEIPDSVTEIGGWAFWGCENLAGIDIPAGVTSIGESAFLGTGLTGITIPDSVLRIEDTAFDYCGVLTYAAIGDGVTYIGERAFHACQGLNSVTFGKSVSEIGEYAFSGDGKRLESITFTGDAPASIASNAFMNIVATVYYPALPSWTPDKLQNYEGTLTWVVSANLPQSAPSGIRKTDETAAGANDGAITGVTSAMEYKKQGEARYTSVAGTSVTGLAPGTYLVRYAAKPGYDASPDTVVVIGAYSAPDLYAVTLHQAQGGTASASHASAAGGETVSLSVLSLNTGYSFVRWDTAPSVTWTAGSADVRNASFAMPYSGVTVTPVYRYQGVAVTGDNGSNDNSDRDSGSSSSGGRDSGDTGTAAPPETWLGAGGAKQPGKSAGKFGVRGSAWAGLSGESYYHDTVAGNTVQVRLYIENPLLFTKDAYLSGYVTGAEVNSTRNIFEKWFQNKMRVIHFDQTGEWEQPVAVAAKLDLSTIDIKRLCFYAYDKKANKYTRIAEPAYRIDQNGYLHFKTPFAGDVIISEGELVKTAAAGESENVSAQP